MASESFIKILYEQNLIDITKKELLLSHKNPVSLLIANNIPISKIANIFNEYFFIEYYNLSNFTTGNYDLLEYSYKNLVKYSFFPIKVKSNTLYISMANPLDIEVIDNIKIISGLNVVTYFSNPRDIQNCINFYYLPKEINTLSPNTNDKTLDETTNLQYSINVAASPVVKILDSLITSAVTQNSSDIHIEPYKNNTSIRFRIDGKLQKFKALDHSLHEGIIARLKIISNMDIGENRIPQEGHFKNSINNETVDFRVSIIPTIYGESGVIRAIYSTENLLSKNRLGFFDKDIKTINRILSNPYGAILVTGPTGSGKTTTLYSFVNQLKSNDLKIITIEDPVENYVSDITQINLNEKVGFNFETALPYILRQDPNIIMIGEIRNAETAKIVTRASITGHTVLTTLHTNDAVSTIIRLLNMGIEGYIIASSIKGIISQRLVRRLCNHCKEEYILSQAESKLYGIPAKTSIYKSVGCSKCSNTGYKGRFAVYEILTMDDKISTYIEDNASQNIIKDYLKHIKFNTIKDCTIKNIILGNTTISEMGTIISI